MIELDCSKQIGKKIFIGDNTKRTINISSILYLESDRNYTTIHFRENNGELPPACERKTLKDFENEFADYGFIRISKSKIVNGKHIDSIGSTSNGKVMYLKKIIKETKSC
jgi:DNA-binding LytR/AlgR family response regulator